MFIASLLLLVCSVIMIVICRVVMESPIPLGPSTKKLVGWMMFVSILNFITAFGMVYRTASEMAPSTIASSNVASATPMQQVVPPLAAAPTIILPVPTATTVPLQEEEVAEFGGILIKNPSKRLFSVMIEDETGEEKLFIVTNALGEDVQKTWDAKLLLPAADNETFFKGSVVSEENKYPFTFDSERDGKSVKELEI